MKSSKSSDNASVKARNKEQRRRPTAGGGNLRACSVLGHSSLATFQSEVF